MSSYGERSLRLRRSSYQPEDEDVEDHRQQRRRQRPLGNARRRRPYASYGSFLDRLTNYTIFDLDFVGFFRILITWIYTIVMIPVRLIILLFRLISLLIRMFYPFLLYLLIIWLLWYLVVIYWPYVIEVVLVVIIPILNVLIMLFNFFFELFIFLWDIAATIWNAVVPFIGMILETVINLVTTIMSAVFNAIGSFDWEPIISGLMQIINIVVEIAVQILVVLIKVGVEILTELSKVITPLINFLLEVVKALIPVVEWIFELLYDILEPILSILGALFGSGGGGTTTSKGSSTGRRLFSVEVHPAVYTPAYKEQLIKQQQQQVDIVASMMPNYESMLNNIPKNISAHEAEEFERIIREIAKEPDIDIDDINQWFRSTMITTAPTESPYHGRQLFSSPSDGVGEEIVWKRKRTDGLRFVDDLTQPHKRAKIVVDEDEEEDDDGHLHDVTNTIARQMLASSNTLRKDTLTRARNTMAVIRATTRHHSKLSTHSILQEEDRKMRSQMPHFDETLASVQYPSTVKHPKHMVASFHDEIKQRQRDQFNTGRKTLGVNWNEAQQEQLEHVKIKHMRQIIEQTKQYTDYHQTNVKLVNVAYAAFTRTMKKQMEEVITPELILRHWSTFLQAFGYKELREVHADYLKTYGNDPWDFMIAMSSFTEHPVLKAFKKADPSNVDSPYWHDWSVEQMKQQRDEKVVISGRRLMQMQSNGDRDVTGDGESKTALSSFATISTLDCFSSPKNPLCLPLIPLSFKFRIPQIHLTKAQVAAIKESTVNCDHWRFTNCLICTDRILNAWTDIKFILSAIPFVNYPIATFTVTVPQFSVFLNWIFVVPKFQMASIHMWVCFVFHLYDLFVTGVILFLVMEIAPEILDLVITTFTSVSSTFALRHKKSWYARARARAVQQTMRQMRISSSIGQRPSPSGPHAPTLHQHEHRHLHVFLTNAERQHLELHHRVHSVPRQDRIQHMRSRLIEYHNDHFDLSQGHDPDHVHHIDKENEEHPIHKE